MAVFKCMKVPVNLTPEEMKFYDNWTFSANKYCGSTSGRGSGRAGVRQTANNLPPLIAARPEPRAHSRNMVPCLAAPSFSAFHDHMQRPVADIQQNRIVNGRQQQRQPHRGGNRGGRGGKSRRGSHAALQSGQSFVTQAFTAVNNIPAPLPYPPPPPPAAETRDLIRPELATGCATINTRSFQHGSSDAITVQCSSWTACESGVLPTNHRRCFTFSTPPSSLST